MGRVRYDQSLYRTGYRPYGKTNPQAAAAGLAGVGRTPFAPERLHGMGQAQPFTRAGGFKLHGLAGAVLGFLGDAGIPNGAILTYQGTWTTTHDPQSIVDGVVAGLNGDGQLTVLQAPTSQDLSSTFWNLAGRNVPFGVKLIVQVTNGMGFGSINDVISIVRHFVYQASGVFPQKDLISQIQAPSQPTGSTPNYQGAGQLNPPAGGICDGDCPGSTPTDFATWLENNALWIALGVGALVAIPKLL